MNATEVATSVRTCSSGAIDLFPITTYLNQSPAPPHLGDSGNPSDIANTDPRKEIIGDSACYDSTGANTPATFDTSPLIHEERKASPKPGPANRMDGISQTPINFGMISIDTP